jgi:dTDP-6-deoxy-L-talose 4-dehydrogenase (NAD+)
MKVAVTGATGFIGSHVVRELARRAGVEVIGVSRGAAGGMPAQVRHVALDIARHGDDPFGALGRPDVLIHLAWDGLPHYRSLHHVERHLFEQIGFVRAMVRGGLRSLLCAGTCLEYGLRSGALAEDLAPDPQTAYGVAKDALRRYLELLRREAAFDLTWARLFYMYGEGQAAGSLYPQLVAAVREGAQRFRMSHGEQLRDYLPVADVARLMVDLALHAPGAGVVNVCSGRPVAVRSLVEKWIADNGWRIELDRGALPLPDYEPPACWGDDRRLRELLPAP